MTQQLEFPFALEVELEQALREDKNHLTTLEDNSIISVVI